MRQRINFGGFLFCQRRQVVLSVDGYRKREGSVGGHLDAGREVRETVGGIGGRALVS